MENAVRLLHYLGNPSNGEASLTEVCRGAGVPRSSGRNILNTLESFGLVRFDNRTRQYGLGWSLVQMGIHAQQQLGDLEAVIRPHLELLSRDTGVTCIMARLMGDYLLIRQKVESVADPRPTAVVNQLYPLTSGALGKAILAYMSETDVIDYARRMGLPAFTECSITSVDALLEDLKEVRRLGYAVSLGEYSPGVNSIACPAFDELGGSQLSLSALGLDSVLPLARVANVGAKVRRTAREITLALGGVWPDPEPEFPGAVG